MGREKCKGMQGTVGVRGKRGMSKGQNIERGRTERVRGPLYGLGQNEVRGADSRERGHLFVVTK